MNTAPVAMTLAECLALAGKTPFTTLVVKGGGEFQEGWKMEVTNVSTRQTGVNKGQLQYDFTVDGAPFRGWRHTSGAEFTLVNTSTTKLPEAIEQFLHRDTERFGCENETVRELATIMWTEVTKKLDAKGQTL